MFKKLQQKFINLLVISITVIICLFLMEGAIRIVFNPIDYMSPEVTQDSILRHRVEPGTGGHDNLGHRNFTVPEQCDIIAVGGSLTYGLNAACDDTWPSQLSNITGICVYNLSTGGYSPPQYFTRLQTEALSLKPKTIICDFALGHNIKSAFKTVYGLNYWTFMRDSSLNNTNIKVGDVNMIITDNKGFFRTWITNKSMLFRILVNKTPLRNIFHKRQLAKDNSTGNSSLIYPEMNIAQGFEPEYRLNTQNLNTKGNMEGLRLCLSFYKKMNDICIKNNIKFNVVIIPTKESVYADYIENNDTLKNTQLIDSLIQNERKVVSISTEFFRRNNIQYVDVLQPLKTAIGKVPIYSNNYDGHPNKNGYAIIAKVVASSMNENSK